MEEGFDSIVYHKNVIEFVTVANEYCQFVENVDKFSVQDFLNNSHKILPLLYLKASMVPDIETFLDEHLDKVVTEADWTYMQGKIAQKIGEYDRYFEYYDPGAMVEGESTEISVSEVYTDIYQDLTDMTNLYRLGNEDIMNDAVSECVSTFKDYWGKRLIGLLEQIHLYLYSDVELGDGEEQTSQSSDNWLISKRLKDIDE